MRKLLNTLYITNEKSYLSLDGENIVVRLEDDEKFRLPLVNIENIVCFNYMGVSPAFMGKCAEEDIGLYFMTPTGKFLASIVGRTKGSVYTRMKQYRCAQDADFCLDFAKNIVSAKLYNTRKNLQRSIRDCNDADCTDLEKCSEYLAEIIDRTYDFNDEDELRGFEGNAARAYFEVFSDMIISQKQDFYLYGRTKRPPEDNVNCMLSYLYIILSFEIRSALETVGLDPYVGFMHKLRAGRASLALDMVEELRAYMVDRLVISMINLKEVTAKDFVEKEGGGVLMTDDCRKKLLTRWQDRKKEIITHPIIHEKIEIGLIPYVQAQLLNRFLREDVQEYSPFLWR
ncbi:MAG: type I-C CRISPR-associated endonuclease Cas1c [Christensenellaceae bacterium]